MKSFFRFLKTNPLYTIINVVGLSVSLMFVILIGDYTWRQLSMDRGYKNGDRIFLLGSQDNFFSWPDASEQLGNSYPEIEKMCRLICQNGKIRGGEYSMPHVDSSTPNIIIADSTFFDFFDFKFKAGESRYALDSPDKCVITEKTAKMLFPNENPIGRTLSIAGTQFVTINNESLMDTTLLYTVSGVVRDLDKTVLPNEAEIIINMGRYPQVLGYRQNNHIYGSGPCGGFKTFLMVKEGADLSSKLSSMNDFIKENVPISVMIDWKETTLTPLTDILFSPKNRGDGLQEGDKGRVTVLLSVVLAILLFAIMNYINLTVANTGFRAKEMATRRLLGSGPWEIASKLIGESSLMVLVSFIIGIALALIFQDRMAHFFRGKISIVNDISPGTISVCALFVLLTGLVSGIVPSMQIAGYKPIDVVKGRFRYHSKMIMSKTFIIIQNIITVSMLTAALTVFLQLKHLINAPLGYETENIVMIMSKRHPELIRTALESLPCIKKTGVFDGSSLMGTPLVMTVLTDETGKNQYFCTSELDSVALDIYGVKILEDYGDKYGGYYLTEKCTKEMKMSEDGRVASFGKYSYNVSGVISDIHTRNILSDAKAFLIKLKATEEFVKNGFIVKTDGSAHALQKISDAVAKADGQIKAEKEVISFEQIVRESFEEQTNTLNLVIMFTIIAVIISILGYIGISLFFIRQREKEIGVRKIMGGSSCAVGALMLRIFLTPLLISFLFAIPLSRYMMAEWLKGFSYRIDLDARIFIISCLASLLIAFVAIIYQITRAVRVNPADSIRKE